MCNQARHLLLEAHKRHMPHQLGRIHLHHWPTALAPLGGNRLQLLLMVVAGLADETEELCGRSFAHKRLAINRDPLRREGRTFAALMWSCSAFSPSSRLLLLAGAGAAFTTGFNSTGACPFMLPSLFASAACRPANSPSRNVEIADLC